MQRICFAIVGIAVLFAGCTEDPVGPVIVLPGPNEPVSYSKHIAPIFAASCNSSGCHGDMDPAGELSLNSWEGAMAGSDDGTMIVPFNGRKSHLLQHINNDTLLAPVAAPHMPDSTRSLPREQILAIKRWIDEGAKNDAGQVALAGDRPRVFVTSQGEDLVTAIDLETQRIARYVDIGRLSNTTSPPEAPHNIVLSPDGKSFYVNLIVGGFIEKYDAVTFAKLGSVDVGLSPAQIVVSSDGSTLYVSNFDLTFTQRFITRVDAASMTRSTDIETGGYAPHGLTFNRDQTSIYSMNAGSDNVSEIDLATGDVKRIIPIVPDHPLEPGVKAKHEPYQSVLSSDGALMFVTCRASAQVRVIDLAAGRVIDSINVGQRPLILERSPDGREIWVPNQASESVSIIDAATRKVVATISGLETQPHAVAFTKDGRTAFVTCENQTGGHSHHPVVGSKVPGIVYVIDAQTHQVREHIEVGAFAAGIVVRN